MPFIMHQKAHYTNLSNKGVFFLSLYSCNFGDQEIKSKFAQIYLYAYVGVKADNSKTNYN